MGRGHLFVTAITVRSCVATDPGGVVRMRTLLAGVQVASTSLASCRSSCAPVGLLHSELPDHYSSRIKQVGLGTPITVAGWRPAVPEIVPGAELDGIHEVEHNHHRHYLIKVDPASGPARCQARVAPDPPGQQLFFADLGVTGCSTLRSEGGGFQLQTRGADRALAHGIAPPGGASY